MNTNRANLLVDDDRDRTTHKVWVGQKSAESIYMDEVFSNKFEAVHALIKRLLGADPPIRRSTLDFYVDTLFADEITLIDILVKFSLPCSTIQVKNSHDNNPKRTQRSHDLRKVCVNSYWTHLAMVHQPSQRVDSFWSSEQHVKKFTSS